MSEQTKANQGVPPPTYQATSNDQFANEAPPKYEDGMGGQQAYPPQQQAYGYQTAYTQQPVLVVNPPLTFSQLPAHIRCPYCQAEVTTATEYEAGALTWLTSGVLCLVGCWLGCCLIPFCINDLQDVKHKCPNCDRVVGVSRRM